MSPNHRALLAALLLALTAGCDATPLGPTGAVRLSPPPEYQQWWAEVVSCAGVSRTSFAAIEWFVVPGGLVFEDPVQRGRREHGLWVDAMPPRIYLAEGVAETGRHVRHEMMHAALRRVDHDREYFGPRCGL